MFIKRIGQNDQLRDSYGADVEDQKGSKQIQKTILEIQGWKEYMNRMAGFCDLLMKAKRIRRWFRKVSSLNGMS